MTNAEVEAILVRAHRSRRPGNTFSINLYWSCCVLSLLTVPTGGAASLLVAGVCACFALVPNAAKREADKDAALRGWRFIANEEERFRCDFTSTGSLKTLIGQIYESDPRGNGFPLSQAVRLLDAHLRQQKRLARVEAHIHSLRQQKEQLLLKLARLHELGEDNPAGRVQLEHLSKDIFALEISTLGIQASCSRLEAIVVKVHKSAEVKKLHREISQLASNQSLLAPELRSEEADDIERQIGREIETFLRLERETDEHLRDV